MDKKLAERLIAISNPTNRTNNVVAKDFINTLKQKLAERKHRADLNLATMSKSTEGTFNAEVSFNPQLKYPTEEDLMTLVDQAYPTHEIDWELIDVDEGSGIISLVLNPSVEVIPVESINSIPPEFTAIGTGMYKRAADASGSIHEIWSLKKTDDGLALFRNEETLDLTADSEDFKAGDVVTTEYGPGRILRFDDLGNAIVQVGSKKHLVASIDMQSYDIDKEKSKLKDYYAQIYGDEFANKLVEDYDSVKEVDMFDPPKK